MAVADTVFERAGKMKKFNMPRRDYWVKHRLYCKKLYQAKPYYMPVNYMGLISSLAGGLIGGSIGFIAFILLYWFLITR